MPGMRPVGRSGNRSVKGMREEWEEEYGESHTPVYNREVRSRFSTDGASLPAGV